MKALSEMTPDELMAVAIAAQEKEAIHQKEMEEAAELVAKLKEQVSEKKEVSAPVTSVKHNGELYVFPTESWTEPNYTQEADTTVVTAKAAAKDAEFVAKLVERGFLKKKTIAVVKK